MLNNVFFNPADTYLHETEELLADIEASALSLTPDPGNADTINRLFRAFHTIKGSGAMFGFTDVSSFTHHVETLLDQIREGLVAVTPALSQVLLESADHIKLLLHATQGGPAVNEGSQSSLLDEIKRLSSGQGSTGAPVERISVLRHWLIEFRPAAGLLRQGGNPLLVFRDLQKLGPCEIEAQAGELPALAALQADNCYLWWTIRLQAAVSEEAIREVFLFAADGDELKLEALPLNLVDAQPKAGAPGPGVQAVGSVPDLLSAVAHQPAKEATVRVPAARLDHLVSLVGELVMNHSRLATAAAHVSLPDLASPIEEIERLVSSLRDDILQIRMMPIGTVFGRFQRLVRDLSLELGKEIRLLTEGEETELDKSILDQVGEPLVHLLRNSVDHGIEAPSLREALGKPRQGTIRLVALHRGSEVVVSIEDDGKGLDTAAIRAKAAAKQLIPLDAALSDKETFNLILLPGFSTAPAVTSISGRGVGMDVVKRQIDALRGSLSISSNPGRGTIIALTLPLTLAIIEGLLVEAADSQYVIPMSLVTENVELDAHDRYRNNGRNVIAVRGELLPYIDLRALFRLPGAPPTVSKIVLVRHDEGRLGLVVDRVVGAHQTVIQTLGPFLRGVEVFSGSTIMGDGRVALIVDVPGILRLANAVASTSNTIARHDSKECASPFKTPAANGG